MSDLISRQAVLESLKTDYSLIMFDSYGNLTFTGGRIIEAIKRVPSVTPQPEVIRCKDCKHWTNNIGDSKLRDNYCNDEAHGFYY